MTDVPMKRRGLLGLIAALPIFGRLPDAGPPSFELVPDLRAGQQWRFAFERKVVRGGAVMHWYRSPLQLRVLETDADGALLEWTEGAQTIVDAHPSRRPLLEMGLATMRDMPVLLRIDTRGRLDSLANLDTVRRHCLGWLDQMEAQWRARPETAVIAEQMVPAMRAAYVSDAMVAASTLKEPAILLGAMGRRFGADEPVQFRTALSNPLGGDPIAAIARFAIRDVRRRAGQADLGWLMVSDPVATDDAARDVAAQAVALAARAAAPDKAQALADAAAALPPVTLEERGDFVVDTATAWPVRVTHARTVRAGAIAQVEETRFSLG